MSANDTTVIWTRSESDWDNDFKLLSRLKAKVLHLPTIELRGLGYELSGDFDQAVFTSPKTFSFIREKTSVLDVLRKCEKIWTFGDATTKSLGDLGVSVEQVDSASSGRELGLHLSNRLSKNASIVTIGAAEPAFDLEGYLLAQGFHAQHFAAYETQLIAPEWKLIQSGLAASKRAVFCFASPSAVYGLCRTSEFSQHQKTLGSGLNCLAIGTTTAAACQEYGLVPHVPERPGIANMVRCLEQIIEEDC